MAYHTDRDPALDLMPDQARHDLIRDKQLVGFFNAPICGRSHHRGRNIICQRDYEGSE